MPDAAPRVRPLTHEDVPASLRTLTRAFADCSFTRHVLAANHHQERLRRCQELFLVRVAMEYGRAWVAGDCRAVAAWTTPDRDPGPGFAVIGPLATELAGDRAAAMESAQEALAPHRPKDPVWFLATVGVDPRARDRSLGTAVIRPGLEGAERAGVPVFLETSEADSVRFYERLGFAVTAEVALPGGGPRTWCMLREPQAPGRQRVAIGQSAGRLRETKYPLRAAARPGRGFEEHL